MSDIMASLAKAAHQAETQRREEEASELLRRDPDRAIPILRDTFVAWTKPHSFVPGDVLQPLKSSAHWAEATGLVMVLRTYEAEDEVCDNALVNTHDMRLLVIHKHGCVAEMAGHSRDFELVRPAAETLGPARTETPADATPAAPGADMAAERARFLLIAAGLVSTPIYREIEAQVTSGAKGARG
jgi:hypothetical protein